MSEGCSELTYLYELTDFRTCYDFFGIDGVGHEDIYKLIMHQGTLMGNHNLARSRECVTVLHTEMKILDLETNHNLSLITEDRYFDFNVHMVGA